MVDANSLVKGATAPFFAPQLSIIIPVHNQWRLTQSCIHSLLKFPPNLSFEIIVVDDGSTDETAANLDVLSRLDGRIRLVVNDPPHRFARACNCGARGAYGDLLLFMNNDIEAREPDWFEPLLNLLQQRPEIGIVAPRLLFPNGTVQHCGKVWHLDSNGVPRSEHYLYEQPAELVEAQQGGSFLTITGACMLLRREHFSRIGPFDERFENGWEDDDLCLAFRSQGLLCWICGESTLVHHQGGTLKAEAQVLERYLGVLKGKDIHLAADDPLLIGLKQQTRAKADQFELAYHHNRQLFASKWGQALFQILVPAESRQDTATIVIVTYNSAKTIVPCLESLDRTVRPGDQVVLVDNNSCDETCTLAAQFIQRLPLEMIKNRENRGFSAASNQGIRQAITGFVVLLNPDTMTTQGWLDRLVTRFSDPTVAAVGPVSNFAAGRQSVACHWQGELPQGIGPEHAAGQLYGMNRGKSEEAKLLIGFCLMIRRTVVQKLGGLDERLFLGNDDLELSWRLRLHGHRLLIAADTFIWHEGQHSFKSEPETVTGKLVQESSEALYWILAAHYGTGRVPSSLELWDVDWFNPVEVNINPTVRFEQVLSLPQAWECPAPSAGRPLVSIIILTYNQWDCTEECLASIKLHTPEPYELIIVDNCSGDGTAERLQALASADSRYRLVMNPENRGYAAGCNQGMHEACGDYIVLLNNDVLVTPEWLSGLLECYATHPLAGIVGPMTNSASGIQVVTEPDYGGLGGLDRFARRFRAQNRFRHVKSRRVVGFCMLFRHALVDEIGLLDEQFGSGNYEDDDFCLRAAVAGYQNLVATDVYIHHHGSMTFKGNNIDYRQALARNAALFHEKWSRPVTAPLEGRRIEICRVLEQGEQLFGDEQSDQALVLLQRSIVEFPGERRLLGLFEQIVSATEECPVLAQARLLKQQGEDEYADTLLLKGFMLEPWRVPLQQALLDMSRAGVKGLSGSADQAFKLSPASRSLARLRVELASLERISEALDWAEHFLAVFGPDDKVLEAGLRQRHFSGHHHTVAPPGKSVSLCMIVKDEEQQLARCLASCKPLVNEMVIVDTGSTDRTRQIAELFGAQVVCEEWQDDFSVARNHSLALASSDWILVMDADEVISPRDYQLFQDALGRASDTQSLVLTTRNYTSSTGGEGFVSNLGEYPESEGGAGWTPSAKVRLFPRNREIYFLGAIHEMVEERVLQAGMEMLPFPVPVHHYGGLLQTKSKLKQEQYLALGLKKLAEQPDDTKALYELAVQAAELEQFETAEQLWTQLLHHQPDFGKAWFNLGYVLLRLGRLQESIQASAKALTLDPTMTDALVNKALCEACLYTGGMAFTSAAEAQQQCPDHPVLSGFAALALYRVGRITEGRMMLDQLRVTGRDCTRLVQGVLEIMEQQGNNPDLPAMRQAVADASDSASGVAVSTSSCS